MYQICKKTGLSAETMYSILKEKFGEKKDFTYMVMGLAYFEDAENELLPRLFVEFDWKETKMFFLNYANQLQIEIMKEIESENYL